MRISGKNLQLVHYALDLAIAETNNQIGHLTIEHEDDINKLEEDRKELERFKRQVEEALRKERVLAEALTKAVSL